MPERITLSSTDRMPWTRENSSLISSLLINVVGLIKEAEVMGPNNSELNEWATKLQTNATEGFSTKNFYRGQAAIGAYFRSSEIGEGTVNFTPEDKKAVLLELGIKNSDWSHQNMSTWNQDDVEKHWESAKKCLDQFRVEGMAPGEAHRSFLRSLYFNETKDILADFSPSSSPVTVSESKSDTSSVHSKGSSTNTSKIKPKYQRHVSDLLDSVMQVTELVRTPFDVIEAYHKAHADKSSAPDLQWSSAQKALKSAAQSLYDTKKGQKSENMEKYKSAIEQDMMKLSAAFSAETARINERHAQRVIFAKERKQLEDQIATLQTTNEELRENLTAKEAAYLEQEKVLQQWIAHGDMISQWQNAVKERDVLITTEREKHRVALQQSSESLTALQAENKALKQQTALLESAQQEDKHLAQQVENLTQENTDLKTQITALRAAISTGQEAQTEQMVVDRTTNTDNQRQIINQSKEQIEQVRASEQSQPTTSCFSSEQIDSINAQIRLLKTESQTETGFFSHHSLKTKKIEGLKYLLEAGKKPGATIATVIADAKSKHPDLTKGFTSHRTRDLLDKLEQSSLATSNRI